MAQKIDPIEDYVAGDTLRIEFLVKNMDSELEIKDLTSAQISWQLRERSQYGQKVLDLDNNSDISVDNLIPTEGAFDILIEDGVTEDLVGQHFQVLEIHDSDGNESTAYGPIIISGIGEDK